MYALTITAAPTPPITLSPTTLPDGTVGAAYAQTVTALGGNGGPYTLGGLGGQSPVGPDVYRRALSGTPAEAGAFTFTITATDGANNTASQAYTLTIGGTTPTPITITPTTLPNGTVGVAYPTQILTAAGGAPPYKGAVTGTVPPGLTVAEDMGRRRTVSGSTDAGGHLHVHGHGHRRAECHRQPELYRENRCTADATHHRRRAPVVAKRRRGHCVFADALGQRRHRAYTFAATTGTLPAGLSLNAATGVLSGTPTTAGVSNFTITATDTTNATGSSRMP